ncbi:universal stress protein [Oceanospirillum linum]|uniref:UspA domain-containing protein n=1 Tax=Oceanospirillum linum TaxID=966 RepID=A0A1T1HG10_OCELI|nr:universal stress protein [Oceanospirillum linum]OOV88783.1 hypothetical protein BTA35_0204715 [Oceanospirillum linum]SEG00083.1 Nucleotide-binding universal stress protein, UspA family [Oleiphilus messinensis]SMP22304.1 Nucleotide-binding universal stress protein, UspA family [Oceanospirillum linum]
MKQFKNILCLLQTGYSEKTVCRVLKIAEQANLSLTLMISAPVGKGKGADVSETEQVAQIRKQLCEITFKEAQGDALEQLPIHISRGKLVSDAIELVGRQSFDLVIKEAEDKDWLDQLLGDDDTQLLRKCPCPVWLLKPDTPMPLKSIMVALDFDHSECGNNTAFNQMLAELGVYFASQDLAALHFVTVYESVKADVLSVWSDEPDQFRRAMENEEFRHKSAALTDLEAELKKKFGGDVYQYISPTGHVVQGVAAEKLAGMVNLLNVGLLIMGTVARTGIKGVVIGNTAESLLSSVKCSVLTVKPDSLVIPGSAS